MKLARPDVFHPRIVLAGCPALLEGDGDDDGLVGALRRRGLHARWLSWDDPADAGRRSGDPAGDVGLHRPARRVPGVDGPGAATCSTRPRWWRGTPTSATSPTSPPPASRRCPSRFFAPGEPVRLPARRGGGQARGRCGIGWRTTVHRSATRRAPHAAALQAEGRTVLVQPYDARIEDGETALVFLGGRQSHAFTKGPILPPPGQAPAFDESGTYAEEALTPADPDFELWDVGHAALAAAAAHLGIERRRPAVRAGRRDRRSATIRGCWNWNWSSRRWAGGNSTTTTRTPAAARVRAGRRVSPRAARARPAVASTPIARRWRPCRRPRRRHGRPPAPRARR